MITHNRFNAYIVLIFSDVKKAQIYKMPYRDSPHHEIEIVMSFDYLHMFGPVENNKNGIFLLEIENKKCVHVGEKFFSFERNDEIVDNVFERGFNDVKHPFAYGKENVYFMLHQNYIPIQDYQAWTRKNEFQYFYKKDEYLKGDNTTDENEGIVDYGNDFINCKIAHPKK